MPTTAKKATMPPQRLATLARKAGWNRLPDHTMRNRIWRISTIRAPWWKYGDRLTNLVGGGTNGNSEPTPPTWWYVRAPSGRSRVTGYPITRYRIVRDWEQMRSETQGLDEDGMYDWRAIGVSQDEDLHLGRMYWGGNFNRLDRAERRILLRWLIHAELLGLFGLRRWLWGVGSHNAVHGTRPGSCAVAPPRGSGGYDHWHCTLDRGHKGLHEHGVWRWGELNGDSMPLTRAARD